MKIKKSQISTATFHFLLIWLFLISLILTAGKPEPVSADFQVPVINLVQADSKTITLDAALPAVNFSQVIIAGQAYISLAGESYVQGGLPGEPALPVVRQDVEVPIGAQVNLELLSIKTSTTSLSDLGLQGVIAPVQASQPKCGDPLDPTPPDHAIYSSEGIFPESYARISGEYMVRGHRVVTLEISPVRYTPASGELEIVSELTLKLNLSGADMAATHTEAERLNSKAFNNIIAETILNYNQGRPLTAPKTGEHYLIITADVYEAGLADFVALKESLGFDVSIASLTDVGGTTTTAIKNYITTQYQGSNPPVYVLLVGDYNDGADSITNYTMTSSSYRTDLYFFTMDGTSDYVPDMFYGRFPVRELSHLSDMIAKYEAYEATSGAEAWVKKAAFLATSDGSNYPIAEGTHNYVISTYTLPHGYTGIFPNNPQPGGDKLYAITYNATTTNVINSINDDRVMVVYSGHGGSTSWAGPNLSQSQVRALTGVAVPYVGSHACVTADFTVNESFGDTWVIEPVNGALTFVGASNNSYWNEDDILERVIFDTLYADPVLIDVPSVGQIKHAGLAAVNTRYYWEEYHVFGDPSLVIVMGPKEPDFTLSVAPTELSTCNDANVTAELTVGSLNDYNSVVTLTASEIPGFDYSITPNSLQAPYDSVLTLDGAGTAPSSTNTVTITGTSGMLTHTTDLTVNVFAPIPSAPELLSPANNATEVPVQPTFTWSAIADAQFYHLEVATDSDFSNLIIDEPSLAGTEFQSEGALQTDTRFYWRVTAENPCGSSPMSLVYSFRTVAGPGDCPSGTEAHIIYYGDFENGADGWVDTTAYSTKWALSTLRYHSVTTSWRSEVPADISDQRLVSPIFSLPTNELPLSMAFWHRWTFDSPSTCNDGAILEISSNNGSTWMQVPANSLLTNPYNGTIRSGVFNPMAGKQAWCGVSDWVWTVVDLADFAGEDVIFRLRMGAGESGGAEGWFVDDVRVQSCVEIPVVEYKIFIPLMQK